MFSSTKNRRSILKTLLLFPASNESAFIRLIFARDKILCALVRLLVSGRKFVWVYHHVRHN